MILGIGLLGMKIFFSFFVFFWNGCHKFFGINDKNYIGI